VRKELSGYASVVLDGCWRDPPPTWLASTTSPAEADGSALPRRPRAGAGRRKNVCGVAAGSCARSAKALPGNRREPCARCRAAESDTRPGPFSSRVLGTVRRLRCAPALGFPRHKLPIKPNGATGYVWSKAGRDRPVLP